MTAFQCSTACCCCLSGF